MYNQRRCIYPAEILTPLLLHSFVQAQRIAALLSASSSFGPAMATIFLTGTWLDLGLSLVLADSLLVCLPSSVGGLLSTGSELVKGTGSELSSRLHEKKKKVKSFHRSLSRDVMLSCKMWSAPQANERRETSSNAAGKSHRQ